MADDESMTVRAVVSKLLVEEHAACCATRCG